MKRWPKLCVFYSACALAVGCGGASQETQKAPTHEVHDIGQEGFDDLLSIQLAETFIEAGAHQNALSLIQTALQRHPDDPKLHYLLGTILRDRGVYRQARAEFARAIEASPKMAPALSGMGILCDLEGDHQAALDWHQKAIEAEPSVARFHNNLGFSQYLAGNYEEAVKSYEAALGLEPTATLVFTNLGYALAALGREDEAMRMFRQTMSEAEALNDLAVAQELRGDQELARATYRRALTRSPGLEEASENFEALKADIQAQLLENKQQSSETSEPKKEP